MKHAIRMLAIVALPIALFGAACPNVTPESKPAAGSWLVLLCRAEDASFDPHPVDYYQALFSKDSANLLWAYFDAVSNHKVDISDSRVRGWFTMTVGSADLDPAVRNAGKPVTRAQTAQDCRSAAIVGLTNQGIGVQPDNYAGVISVINLPVDMGATAGKNVVFSNQLENDLTVAEHEMLHVYGLPHSNLMSADASADHIFAAGTDQEYNDCWDMMSADTCVWVYNTSHGRQGPTIQPSYLQKLQWIDPAKVYAPGPVSVMSSILLAPVSQPTRTGYLFARLEVPAGSYLVEFHEKSGLDQGIPDDAVLIKEERGARNKTYLVSRQNNGNEWHLGDVFTDTRNFLRIAVTDMSSGHATISINTAYAPGVTPAADGETCGDPAHGQTIPCAAMLRCGQKRISREVVSSDYRCQP